MVKISKYGWQYQQILNNTINFFEEKKEIFKSNTHFTAFSGMDLVKNCIDVSPTLQWVSSYSNKKRNII